MLNLNSGDNAENAIALKQSLEQPSDANNLKKLYKANCKILIATPNNFLHLYNKQLLKNAQCNSLIVDKIDMHIALELGSELGQIA